MHSWDQMKPRTVYEKAVQDFTETARRLARLNQRFRGASFAEFEMLMGLDDEASHGTKTSYRRDCCSCNGVDHPNGHGVGHAVLVTDLPSSTLAFLLSLQSPTTGLRNESVDGSDCPTLRVECRPSS